MNKNNDCHCYNSGGSRSTKYNQKSKPHYMNAIVSFYDSHLRLRMMIKPSSHDTCVRSRTIVQCLVWIMPFPFRNRFGLYVCVCVFFCGTHAHCCEWWFFRYFRFCFSFSAFLSLTHCLHGRYIRFTIFSDDDWICVLCTEKPVEFMFITARKCSKWK